MNYTTNLYEIIKKTETLVEIKLCDEKHKIFKAHFPDNPILPGFLQLDIAQELFNLKFIKIKKAKFLKLIKPTDIVYFEHQKDKNKILIKSIENKKISEISYDN